MLDCITAILEENHAGGHCGPDCGSCGCKFDVFFPRHGVYTSSKKAGVKIAQNGHTQATRKVVVERRKGN